MFGGIVASDPPSATCPKELTSAKLNIDETVTQD